MNQPEAETAPARTTLAAIADVFVRYANFTLGGGSLTAAVLHRELLGKWRWISVDNFTLCFGLARLTPGTNVLAFCTGVGCWWGALVAPLASSIPRTIMVVVVVVAVVATALFSEAEGNRWVQAGIHGAIATAVAITVKTCWTIAHPHWKGRARPRVAAVGAAAFLLYGIAGLSAIEVLLLAAVVGAVLPLVRV